MQIKIDDLKTYFYASLRFLLAICPCHCHLFQGGTDYKPLQRRDTNKYGIITESNTHSEIKQIRTCQSTCSIRVRVGSYTKHCLRV